MSSVRSWRRRRRRSPAQPRTRLSGFAALVASTDGFELAEIDLELRGGGQFLGTRQHGATDLHFAHIRLDRPLLERARTVSRELAVLPDVLGDAVDALFAGTDPDALA